MPSLRRQPHRMSVVAPGRSTISSSPRRSAPTATWPAIGTLLIVSGLGCAADDGASVSPSATATATSSTPSSGGAVPPGASPEEQCLPDRVPLAAAYALADGTLRWVSCTNVVDFRSLRAVTDDAVYVTEASGETIALDPVDGTPLATAPPPPIDEIAPPPPGEPARVAVDGYEVKGGQDDGVTVYEGDGSVAWSKPGVWVYDDVWAIDDGAVFAVERDGSRLVAYELATGDERWHVTGDPYAEGLWPWLAQDGMVITMWSNVQVRDTTSGELVWRTRYPRPANPNLRMAGVAIDDDTVFVGFGSAPSDGD